MKIWTRKVSQGDQHEISIATANSNWQMFREKLKGTSTEFKLDALEAYLQHDNTRTAQVRVNNYMNSLLRSQCLKRTAKGLEVLK